MSLPIFTWPVISVLLIISYHIADKSHQEITRLAIVLLGIYLILPPFSSAQLVIANVASGSALLFGVLFFPMLYKQLKVQKKKK